jgi:peptidoglycan/LPS O-acetylase OafA/YrhL
MPQKQDVVTLNPPHEALITPLDGLRGFAALIVIVSHFSNETLLWNGLLGRGAGQTGVMLFFILSGFLMAYLHIDQPFTAANVRQYALRRIARVYPLFLIAALLPVMLLELHFPGGIAMNTITMFPEYLRQITLIDRGALVFWTIRVELLFYASFIGIWLLHRSFKRSWVTAAFLLAAIAFLRARNYNFQIEFFVHVHYFLFGVLSALAFRKGSKFRNPLLATASVLLLAAMPLTYPMIWVMFLHHAPIPQSDILLVSWRSDLVAILLIASFNFILRDERWLSFLLSSPPARWLGRVSYSVYLLHYFVISALLSWLPKTENTAIRFSLCLILILIVAELSNRFVERPLQRLVLSLPQRLIISRRLQIAPQAAD